MRLLVFISILLTLGCGRKEPLIETVGAMPEFTPGWVTSRPISGLDYIGIGQASKSSPDYVLAAKRRALNDLASEIEVSVSSESVLYTLERDRKVEDTFSEVIFLSTDLDLEGFEAFDSWENEQEYHLYYRLDKAAYARMKEQKRQEATQLAHSRLLEARKAYAKGEPATVARLAIESLETLQPYWNEPNPFADEKDVGLGALRLLGDMRTALDFGLLADRIILNEQIGYAQRLKGGMTLAGTLVSEGRVELLLDAAKSSEPARDFSLDLRPSTGPQTVRLKFDPFFSLRGQIRRTALNAWSDLIAPIEGQVVVETQLPAVLMEIDYEGQAKSASTRANFESRSATVIRRLGFDLNGSDARHSIRAVISGRSGGMAFGQQVSFSSMVMQLVDRSSGRVVSESVIDEVKGIHLTEARSADASLDAIDEKVIETGLKLLIDGLL